MTMVKLSRNVRNKIERGGTRQIKRIGTAEDKFRSAIPRLGSGDRGDINPEDTRTRLGP